MQLEEEEMCGWALGLEKGEEASLGRGHDVQVLRNDEGRVGVILNISAVHVAVHERRRRSAGIIQRRRAAECLQGIPRSRPDDDHVWLGKIVTSKELESIFVRPEVGGVAVAKAGARRLDASPGRHVLIPWKRSGPVSPRRQSLKGSWINLYSPKLWKCPTWKPVERERQTLAVE